MLKTLQIKTTKRDEMIDITREVEAFLQETGITSGAALIYCPHTTAGITINENADPDVKGYYFVRFIKWSSQDPIVTRNDLEKMEWAANQYFGTAPFYRKRKAFETPSSGK
ncbi:hypothetical protein EUA35_15625 [Bacillus subtilis]|nr:hypothetical protein EUA35_15625 [Bacillus subtilis]